MFFSLCHAPLIERRYRSGFIDLVDQDPRNGVHYFDDSS